MENRDPRNPSNATVPTFRRRIVVGSVCSVLLLGGVALVGLLRKPSSSTDSGPAAAPLRNYVELFPDPRLTYETPYRNVRPDVNYVGDAACASCHASKAASFHDHRMGRASAPATVESALAFGSFNPAGEPVPGLAAAIKTLACLEAFGMTDRREFTAQGFRYTVECRGTDVIHREARYDASGLLVAQVESPVAFVMSTGFSRGQSYIINRNGRLTLSPIGRYPAARTWDLSPTYDQLHWHFERPIPGECMFCHVNFAERLPMTLNHYREPVVRGYAVGCERCHGPGELHVAQRKSGPTMAGRDATIVNPRDLPNSLREDVCHQCHLQGSQRVMRPGRSEFDFRPGMPLHLFRSIFVPPSDRADPLKAITTVEQMGMSRCFQKSAGGAAPMGCISCHDPHRLPTASERVGYYRDRCLQCHSERGCRLDRRERRAANANNSCIDCHMPRVASSNITHVPLTDHAIPRRAVQRPAADNALVKYGELVHFHAGQIDADSPANLRDLGCAYALAAKEGDIKLAPKAVALLNESLERWPEDFEAREFRALAFLLQRRERDALADCEAILAQVPDREATLPFAGMAASRLGQLEKASGYWRRAVAINPYAAHYHREFARVLMERKDWTSALEEARAALRLNPAALDARRIEVRALHSLGRTAEARQQLAILLRFQPLDAEQLRRQYAGITP